MREISIIVENSAVCLGPAAQGRQKLFPRRLFKGLGGNNERYQRPHPINVLYDNDGYDDDDDDVDEYDDNDDHGSSGAAPNSTMSMLIELVDMPFWKLLHDHNILLSMVFAQRQQRSCRTHRDSLLVASTSQHGVNRHCLTKDLSSSDNIFKRLP